MLTALIRMLAYVKLVGSLPPEFCLAHMQTVLNLLNVDPMKFGFCVIWSNVLAENQLLTPLHLTQL
jgi:hypothetical protein